MARRQFGAPFRSGVSVGWVTTLGSCLSLPHLSVTCDGNSRACCLCVNSSYKIADKCMECVRLLSNYEAATFEQAKIHNALDTAQYREDRLAHRVLKMEAYAITSRRGSAHLAFVLHQDEAHGSADMMEMAAATVLVAKQDMMRSR